VKINQAPVSQEIALGERTGENTGERAGEHTGEQTHEHLVEPEGEGTATIVDPGEDTVVQETAAPSLADKARSS